MQTVSMILDIWAILMIVLTVFLIWRGLLPALWRLGGGLSNKKIAIYAKGDNAEELKKLVSDLKIFKGQVVVVRSDNELGDAETAHIHLIRWCDFKGSLDKIMLKKHKNDALIVYCPFKDGQIIDELELINSKENSLIVGFRGRLLNDIVTSLITTSYEKR
jgi:hypothetical protein